MFLNAIYLNVVKYLMFFNFSCKWSLFVFALYQWPHTSKRCRIPYETVIINNSQCFTGLKFYKKLYHLRYLNSKGIHSRTKWTMRSTWKHIHGTINKKPAGDFLMQIWDVMKDVFWQRDLRLKNNNHISKLSLHCPKGAHFLPLLQKASKVVHV